MLAGGPQALPKLRVPVNKFPDFVHYIVQRLKVLCPTLGKVKIAEMLARAGLHLGPSTVGRMLKQPTRPKPANIRQQSGKVVTANRPNHVWHVDLTVVPINSGFWAGWLPFALPQCWPFCWWVAVVMDHFSRRVMGFAIFQDKPTSEDVRTFLDQTISREHAKPKYLICDHGSQFDCGGFKVWCKRKDIKPRFGALGQHGSLAVIERMIQTLKNEATRRILVPIKGDAFRREVSSFFGWYYEHRPHMSLADCTPNEVYHDRPRAIQQPRWEPRPGWPNSSRCARPQTPVDDTRSQRCEFEITFRCGRRHLPIVTLGRAA